MIETKDTSYVLQENSVEKINVYDSFKKAKVAIQQAKDLVLFKVHTTKDGDLSYAKTKLTSHYHENWKAAYILYRQDANYSFSAVATAQTAFNNLTDAEDRLQKGMEKFSEEEFSKEVTRLTETRQGRSVEQAYVVYRDYLYFVNENFDKSVTWSYRRVALSKQVEQHKTEINYEDVRQALLDFGKTQEDVLAASIALMALLGVKVSGNNQGMILSDDELSHIKKADLTPNYLHIPGKYERKIPLKPEEYAILKQGLNAEMYYDYAQWRLEKLATSKYFFASSQTGLRLESYSYVTGKMMKVKHWLEKNAKLNLNTLGVRTLKVLGQKHLYKELLKQGLSKDAASMRTCVTYAVITDQVTEDNERKRLNFLRNLNNAVK